MNVHDRHAIDYGDRPIERLEALPPDISALTEDRAQPEQLSLLARIVMETLGLTLEEAQQMAKDLGFQNI